MRLAALKKSHLFGDGELEDNKGVVQLGERDIARPQSGHGVGALGGKAHGVEDERILAQMNAMRIRRRRDPADRHRGLGEMAHLRRILGA